VPADLKGFLSKLSAGGGGDQPGGDRTRPAGGRGRWWLRCYFPWSATPGHENAKELAAVAPQERVAREWAQRLKESGTKVHTLWVKDQRRRESGSRRLQGIGAARRRCLRSADGSDDILDMAVLAMLERLRGAEAVVNYGHEFKLSDAALTFQRGLLLEHKPKG